MADALGGIHMAHQITRPYANEFMELFTGTGDTQLRLEEFSHDQFKSDSREKSISEPDVRSKTGATMAGFKDQEGFKFRPGSKTAIGSDGDIVVILDKEQEVQTFKSNDIK